MSNALGLRRWVLLRGGRFSSRNGLFGPILAIFRPGPSGMRQVGQVCSPGSSWSDASKVGAAMLTFRAFAFEIMVSIHKVRDAIAGAIVACK